MAAPKWGTNEMILHKILVGERDGKGSCSHSVQKNTGSLGHDSIWVRDTHT